METREFEQEHIRKIFQEINANISSLRKARELVEKRKYKRALSLYISALDGTVGIEEDLNLEKALETLINKYPPAREALETLRDSMESWIANGKLSLKLHQEWSALNTALGEREREVQLLKNLTESDEVLDDFYLYQTVKMNLPKLLQNKNYQVIEPHLNRLGFMFLATYSNYERELYFPLKPERGPDIALLLREQISEEAPLIYEACLGLKHTETAQEFAIMVLMNSRESDDFRSFLNAAKRTGNSTEIPSLMQKAEKQISTEELSKLKSDLNL
jgi:hypothetical protein